MDQDQDQVSCDYERTRVMQDEYKNLYVLDLKGDKILHYGEKRGN